MKVERRADHAVSEESCKRATGRSIAGWYRALDRYGGVARGRRRLLRWLGTTQALDAWWALTVLNEYEIARGDLAGDGRPRGYHIRLSRTLHASARRCFAAFASARALDQWFGPRHELDLRSGGYWRNADGNRATIHQVKAGKGIQMLAGDEGLTLPATVSIRFSGSGGKCRVTIDVDRLQTRAEADGYRRAWHDALTRLKSYLEDKSLRPPLSSARAASRGSSGPAGIE